ncbi:MAG: SusF/SusE family outer membrane protein [Bacteroidales bacterium]|nr:SusF/SusE family outer membrane protein [Bacteroidales bacterium]
MKITKYFLSLAAAAGMIAGCQKPEMIQIAAPEDVKAPVLEEIQGPIEITPSNMALEKVTFAWSAADYGVATQVNYSLEAATAAAPAKVVTITSGLTTTSAELTYDVLNQILFNDLELADGVAEDVLFMVASKVGEYAPVYSNAITVSCKVTAAEKVYPKLTVAGSYAYNNWTPGKGQFVFDFEGTDAKYSGVIDFGEDVSALQFKFVGEAWGNNEFSVPAGETQAPEAAELPLVAGGGDNIAAYTTHRFYSLTLDKSAPKVIKNFSFNSLGVIGDATPTGWDADTDMQFNPEKQRFYVDLTLIDGKIKFRADDAWDVNWGGADGTLSAGGADIAVTAGDYRIYVNLNDPANPTYELNAGMFGKEEPVGGNTTPEPEPEPTPVVGWGLVGEYNGWGDEPDVMLASDGTYLAVKGVALSGQIKFRKDGAWEVNFGAPGDVEPVEVTVNTELELVAGGKNFTIAEGTYDVYLDEANAKAWFITDGSYPGGGAAPEASEWGIVGVVNGWNAPDITMYKTSTEGLFVAYNVAMPDGGFKIRANGQWVDTANYGLAAAGPVEVDHVYDLICSGGSGDMTLVAGTYDIWFDLTNTKVYIMTPGKPISEAVGGTTPEPEPTPDPDPSDVWGVVGTITGWADNADINMVEEGDWFVAKGVALTATDEFKFRTNGTWGTERTATTTEPVAINTEYEAAAGSGNIKVAVDGTYDLYLAKTLDKFYVMTAGLTPGQTPGSEEPEFEAQASEWGVVGVVNGWNAPDVTMYTTPTEGLFVAYNVAMPDGGFKIRANGEWNDAANYGFEAAGTAAVNHAYKLICGGGSNDITLVAGNYDIWFDLTNSMLYVMAPGTPISEAEGGIVEAPDPSAQNWYLVGNFNGWATGDANYQFTKEGDWYVFKGFTADGQGVKFNAGSWDENRGGTFVAANEAIAVAHNGSDMLVAAGTYDVYMNAATDTAYFMEVGKTPAN